MSNTSDWSLNPHFPCCRVLPTQTPMLGAQRYQRFSLSLSLSIYIYIYIYISPRKALAENLGPFMPTVVFL